MNTTNKHTGFMKMKGEMVRLVFIPLLFLAIPFRTEAQSVEYFVKASLITKIAQYTEWDSTASSDVFEIAILGKSPFKGELEKLASSTQIKNKPIKISYIRNYNEAKTCEIMFVSQSERNNLDEIVKFFEGKNTMLIADTPEFSEKGIHFNFYLDPDKTIHFEIDLNALKGSGLKPDLQLLTIGKIINKP